MNPFHHSIRCALAVLMLSVSYASSGARAADKPEYAELIKNQSSSLVTIRYVLTLSAAQGEIEREQEATGVIVDPQGLILASNIRMGDVERILRLRAQGRPLGISTKVKDIRVLIGDDTVGAEADFVARDSELDLAWLRLKDPREAPYPHTDFDRKAVPELGDRVLGLRRLGKYFDHVVVVGDGHVAGIINKPRRLYKLSGDAGDGIGLPVYSPEGRIYGFSVIQLPNLDDIGGDFAASIGGMQELQTLAEGLILPIDEVIQATERAKVRSDGLTEDGEKADGEEGDGQKKDDGRNGQAAGSIELQAAPESDAAVEELEEVDWDEVLKREDNTEEE